MIVTAEAGYEVDPDVVLTVQDSHDLGNCNKGARAFFRRRGLDWGAFVREGIRTGDFGVFDERVRPVYERALERLGRG
jgi:hypothetical protein